MTGRPHEGVAWVDSLQSNWAGCNNFAFHAFWHRCLFLMSSALLDRVLDLYDRDVRPKSTDDLLDISNAVALLWRLEQACVDVGNRWEELADRAQGHLDDHLLVFGDVTLMALAAAGRAGDAARMVEGMRMLRCGRRRDRGGRRRRTGVGAGPGAARASPGGLREGH